MALSNIPLQLFVPIGAIFAACITGAISFISLVISKEQKISEFRQAWIDGLRAELAEFASQARRISLEQTPESMREQLNAVEEMMNKNLYEQSSDPFHEHRQRMSQAYFALRLRLNPSEENNIILLNHLNDIYQILITRRNRLQYNNTVKKLDEMASVAQVVLKSEWMRVKKGEKVFRVVTSIAEWLAILFSMALFASIIYAIYNNISSYKPLEQPDNQHPHVNIPSTVQPNDLSKNLTPHPLTE
jgi:flagellin-specific chaperone FliS